jgi:hypothetical protein
LLNVLAEIEIKQLQMVLGFSSLSFFLFNFHEKMLKISKIKNNGGEYRFQSKVEELQFVGKFGKEVVGQ